MSMKSAMLAAVGMAMMGPDLMGTSQRGVRNIYEPPEVVLPPIPKGCNRYSFYLESNQCKPVTFHCIAVNQRSANKKWSSHLAKTVKNLNQTKLTMQQLIIYISKDHKIQRVLTFHIKQSIPLDQLAREMCEDCGDEYHGHKVVKL